MFNYLLLTLELFQRTIVQRLQLVPLLCHHLELFCDFVPLIVSELQLCPEFLELSSICSYLGLHGSILFPEIFIVFYQLLPPVLEIFVFLPQLLDVCLM